MKLLTIDDLASLYCVSRRYARDKLVKDPDFPPPAFNRSQKMRRWLESDVLSHLSAYSAGAR